MEGKHEHSHFHDHEHSHTHSHDIAMVKKRIPTSRDTGIPMGIRMRIPTPIPMQKMPMGTIMAIPAITGNMNMRIPTTHRNRTPTGIDHL